MGLSDDLKTLQNYDTPTPSAARHEHEWRRGGYLYRVRFCQEGGRSCWISEWKIDGDVRWCERNAGNYDVASEIARLAGLTPPEER